MTESLESPSDKFGLAPGTLVHVGEVSETEVKISVVDYTGSSIEEYPATSIDEILQYKDTDSVTWINIDGLHDTGVIESIGTHFGIHSLVLEDILNTHQRPKIEESADHLFIVAKGLIFDQEEISVDYEQISILVLDGFVFTFKERPDDLFDPVRQRLRNGKGQFRSQGADYLAYVILDTIVDRYFVFQDSMDDVLESIDNELLFNPTSKTLNTIQRIKREMIFVRRSVSPLRELLATLLRSETGLIKETTKVYLRDVYDHAIRVIEGMDSYRDLIAGMLDIYLSSVSNKMNEVMKVLTVFASIFIPLTFVAGIYGMNFEYMPELKWKWAYPALWVCFISISGFLLFYFRKKKWL